LGVEHKDVHFLKDIKLSNKKLTDIVYHILLDGVGTNTSDALDILQSLSRNRRHKLYDDMHEVVSDGIGKKIPITNILAASLKVEDIILKMNEKRGIVDDTGETIELAWKLIWDELISTNRVRVIPNLKRSKFAVVK